MDNKLLVIGNSSIDNIIRPNGLLIKDVCGGNAFHASMAASILSSDVAILSNIPENFPVSYEEKLKHQGIDCSLLLKRQKAVNFTELFIYCENGDREDGIFGNLEPFEDNTIISPYWIERLKFFSTSDLYTYQTFREDFAPDVSEIPESWNLLSIHLAPTVLDVHKDAIALKPSIITLDPGRYLKQMSYDEVVDLVSKVTVFAPSKKEMLFIFPNLDLLDAVKKLARDSGSNIICKNGPQGCFVYDIKQNKCFSVDTYPSEVKDFTGAGDSFCGALNASLVNGHSLLDSARCATVVAAKAIETVSAVERNKIDKEFVMSEYQKVNFSEVC